MQSEIHIAAVVFFAARARCWFVLNSLSTRTSGSFTARPLSSCISPSMSWSMGLFLSRCRTLYFSLLNLMRISPVPCTKTFRNPTCFLDMLPLMQHPGKHLREYFPSLLLKSSNSCQSLWDSEKLFAVTSSWWASCSQQKRKTSAWPCALLVLNFICFPFLLLSGSVLWTVKAFQLSVTYKLFKCSQTKMLR